VNVDHVTTISLISEMAEKSDAVMSLETQANKNDSAKTANVEAKTVDAEDASKSGARGQLVP
jgi:hypothetical protein